KIGLPDGASIVFHLPGPVKRDLPVVVDGRARAVDHVEHPDVELTTDTVTFVQLAAGRIDPQGQIDAGLVTWTGNAGLGDRAPPTLNFTIYPPGHVSRRLVVPRSRPPAHANRRSRGRARSAPPGSAAPGST